MLFCHKKTLLTSWPSCKSSLRRPSPRDQAVRKLSSSPTTAIATQLGFLALMSRPTRASASMMRSNSRPYSSGDMNAFFTCSSSTSATSEARRCSSSTSTSSVGRRAGSGRIEIGAAGERSVRALRRRLAADAVAVVVEQRTLGRELPALLIVPAHGAGGPREGLPDRRPAVLVDVRRLVAEGGDEVLGKHRVEALRDRIGGGDDDAPRPAQALDEGRARGRRIDDDDPAREAAHQRRPFARDPCRGRPG